MPMLCVLEDHISGSGVRVSDGPPVNLRKVRAFSKASVELHWGSGLPPCRYATDELVSAGSDPPRESEPTGSRDFGLVWSVGARYFRRLTHLTYSIDNL